MITFESASDFEKVVALLLNKAGWEITMPPSNTRGYDIEAVKGSAVLAVQVKNLKTDIRVPQIEKFLDFLELPIAAKFTGGLFVTSSGYTMKAIRSINKDAYLFVLINNYFPDENKKSQVLKYQLYFAELSKQDSRFKFIDPDEVAIRNSKQLFYWGYHIYVGSRSELAFTPVGGRCLPKADFLNLLDYLESHSDIEKLKN
ncbi:MAG: restriction endonuclease [Aphanizomenon sp.]|jgi:hypothetical protein|nr:MAG: hypothetical protein AN488_06790 [Anabaena sp. WA113]